MKRFLVLAACSTLYLGCDNSEKQAELKRLENQQIKQQNQLQEEARSREQREIARAKEKEDYAKKERQKELDREQLKRVQLKQNEDKFKADLDKLRSDGNKFDQQIENARKMLK